MSLSALFWLSGLAIAGYPAFREKARRRKRESKVLPFSRSERDSGIPTSPRSEPADILMVLTRDPYAQEAAGRPRLLQSIIGALGNNSRLEIFRLRSLLQRRAYFQGALQFAHRIMMRPRWPLQCLLFEDRDAIPELLRIIRARRPLAVYFDTVRCYAAIQAVRKEFPDLRLICDFDDLMSRRMREVRRSGHGVSIGYLREYTPVWLRDTLENATLSRLLLSYEAAGLARVEQEILRTVESVVLVSSGDAEVLRQECPRDVTPSIAVLPPPFTMRKHVQAPTSPIRFIFIGSDKFLQNRLTIEWLLRVWKEHRIERPLHIFGEQVGTYKAVENVFWHGFAANLDDVYSPGSIMVAPSFLAGGVKTKICEAVSFGVIPLGNSTSFEGIDLRENGLAMSELALIATLQSIDERVALLTTHASRLQAYLSSAHGADTFRDKWHALFAEDRSQPFVPSIAS